MFWNTMDFCMKLLKAEWKVIQQEGEEEFKCYKIWQMMVALLHSNGQPVAVLGPGQGGPGPPSCCAAPPVFLGTTYDALSANNRLYIAKFIPVKIHETVDTRAAHFGPDVHEIVCRLGLRPRPHWGSLQRSPRPPSCIKGAYF